MPVSSLHLSPRLATVGFRRHPSLFILDPELEPRHRTKTVLDSRSTLCLTGVHLAFSWTRCDQRKHCLPAPSRNVAVPPSVAGGGPKRLDITRAEFFLPWPLSIAVNRTRLHSHDCATPPPAWTPATMTSAPAPGSGPRPPLQSRNSAGGASSGVNTHAPANPSGLRQSYTRPQSSGSNGSGGARNATTGDDGDDKADEPASARRLNAGPSEQRPVGKRAPTEITGLLRGEQVHEGPCNHGTFSPRPSSPTTSILSSVPSIPPSESGALLQDGSTGSAAGAGGDPNWKKNWAKRIRSTKMANSRALAEQHGIKDSTLMYD